MIYGFLIAFIIAFVIGISIAIVIVIALWETTSHMYEGGGSTSPMQTFRSHLRQSRDADLQGGKKASRHRHYHA